MKNTVGAFDWILFRVLHSGPLEFKPRTSAIGAFRDDHGAMPPAGPVVVVEDYRPHLHVIQSNAPKLIKLHPPFIYLSQAYTSCHTMQQLISMLPQKIFKNHKIFEKKSQDLDSKSQVYKIKLLMTFYAKLKLVITSESTVMTFELHRLS